MKKEKPTNTASTTQIELPDFLYQIEIRQELHAPREVLITNAETVEVYLENMATLYKGANFTVSFKNKENLKKWQDKETPKNLHFINYDASESFGNPQYNLILNFPALNSKDSIEYEETENLLTQLKHNGRFVSIYPYGITYKKDEKMTGLREFINKNYSVEKIINLPAEMFESLGLPTVMLKIEKGFVSVVDVYSYTYNKEYNRFTKTDKFQVSFTKFKEKESWDTNALAVEDDPLIQEYMSSRVMKRALSEVADVFRGKTINKKETDDTDGNIGVINISDIKGSVIDFSSINLIKEDERKNKNFELIDNDILLTARGTDIRTAVFQKPDEKMYIPSANLIVIRPKSRTQQHILILFFESIIGKKLLESCQKGTAMMNILANDVKNIIVPYFNADESGCITVNYKKARQNFIRSQKKAEMIINTARLELEKFYDEYTTEYLLSKR